MKIVSGKWEKLVCNVDFVLKVLIVNFDSIKNKFLYTKRDKLLFPICKRYVTVYQKLGAGSTAVTFVNESKTNFRYQ